MDVNVKFKTVEELKEWLRNREVDEDDVETAATKLFTNDFNKPSRLLGITVEELKNDAGIQNPLARELSNNFKPRQPPQRFATATLAGTSSPSPSSTSRRRIAASIPPPSDGKKPPKRPKTGSLGPPSGDDNKPTSPRSALRYVAAETLHCSSNTIAMQVLQLLQNAVTEDLTTTSKYVVAANYVLKARKALMERELADEQVSTNERFYTGALCDALNGVLCDDDTKGVSVLHQGCIGHGSTHSDFSARNVLSGTASSTLLVGEAKATETSLIQEDVWGQLFNELIRHRKIDAKLGFHVGARPVLLLAVNFAYITLDLAFPSKKGNSMEKKGWLTFSNLPEETETFWTAPLLSVNYSRLEGANKLPKVLRFIADALKYLKSLDANLPRQQFKTPLVTSTKGFQPTNGEKRGESVTILEAESGTRRVYKEFCYYLREADDFNALEWRVRKDDQRKPPDKALLQGLGDPYANWKVEQGPFDIRILSYDFIEGVCGRPTSKRSWMAVLNQVRIMHGLDYVHGDLLPRNLVFSADNGYVIDFDLTRKVGGRYVSKYNHDDFVNYRHESAKAGQVMQKEHDVWALMKMTDEFFEVGMALEQMTSEFLGVVQVNNAASSQKTIEELIDMFEKAGDCELRVTGDQEIDDEATGSPQKGVRL